MSLLTEKESVEMIDCRVEMASETVNAIHHVSRDKIPRGSCCILGSEALSRGLSARPAIFNASGKP